MLTRLGRKKTISHTTAMNWLSHMGYCWTYDPKGQYVNGHKQVDVVNYWQNIFLPAWKKLEGHMNTWTLDSDSMDNGEREERTLVVWFHDESTFYAHDQHQKCWVHKSEKAVPFAKGEGASLMVADFVSADHGWLCSPDGKEPARVLFKVGKARAGYYTNKDIMEQVATAMDIVEKHYPDEDHLFVYDNTMTHLKQPEDALSPQKMPKGISNSETNFGVLQTVIGENGKPVHAPDGTILKEKVKMANGKFKDGTEQSFYFPKGHQHPGLFNGMAIILGEHGFIGLTGKRAKLAQCRKNILCAPGATDCCCQRILYNQLDFMNVESHLETVCKVRGHRVLFLPKFHCELNFIEQCWGYAKHCYHHFPPSSKEEDLERNVIKCLDGVPLLSMRK
jgi:hypothetical protein